MNRLSSNTTLMWKFFIPTFYISFVGLFLMAVLFLESDEIALFYTWWSKVLALAVYLFFIFLMWRTVFRLKRVEEEGDYIYVSDYFKTYKYQKADIETVKSSNYGLMNLITITMKSNTSLGKKIRFIGKESVIGELYNYH